MEAEQLYNENTRNFKNTKINIVNDDYGLGGTGITNNMRRSSHKKITKNLGRGIRYQRPEFSVEKEDNRRGIKVYEGQEARSRQSMSSERKNFSGHENYSPNKWTSFKRKNMTESGGNSLKFSTEVKVKIRPGKRRESNQKSSYTRRTGQAVNSLGGYLERRIGGGLVKSIDVSKTIPKKVNINQMINGGRESRWGGKSGRLVESITKETSRRRGSRSGSSLKHEVKVRSISRSRNLISLDEYCNRIERESRYTKGKSQKEDERSFHSQRKIETLMSNLQKIKTKPVEKPMNNDYYALGHSRKQQRQFQKGGENQSRKREYRISESRLRHIRQMFPFNQVWFWDLSSSDQQKRLMKSNSKLLKDLKIPVEILISKVKQSDHVVDSKIINLSRDKITDSFADKHIEFSGEIKAERRPMCTLIQHVMGPGDDEEDVKFTERPIKANFPKNENWEEEMKGAPMGKGKKEFEDDDFSDFNFNRRREKQGFDKVGFKDRRNYNKPKEVNVGSRLPPQPKGEFTEQVTSGRRNMNPRRGERGVGSRNVGGRRHGERKVQRPANVLISKNNGYYAKNNARGLDKSKSQNRSANQFKNQVRIRKKTRDYTDKNFVKVNRKVLDNRSTQNNQRNFQTTNWNANSRADYFGQSNSQRFVNRPTNSNYFSNQNFGSNRRIQPEKNKIYIDRINVEKDQNESEDFDDDYFEERDPRFKKKVASSNQKFLQKLPSNNQKRNIKKRVESPEQVYVDEVVIQKDSEEEDYGDEYFEERDARKRGNRRKNQRRPPQGLQNKRIQGREEQKRGSRNNPRSSEEVYHDEIQIMRSSKDVTDEDFGDDYFEERDSHTWKQKQKVFLNKTKEGMKANYFKNGQHVNHKREDSPDRVYVDTLHIPKDENEEDYDDDYFEERDSDTWKKKKIDFPSKAKQSQFKKRDSGPKNLFKTPYESSEVGYNSKVSSGVRQTEEMSSRENSAYLLSGRFKSFAPQSLTNTAGNSRVRGNEVETHVAYIESKNEMSPDPHVTNREMKGPNQELYGNLSAKQTQYTSSTYHNSQYDLSNTKRKPGMKFNNPYNAQIFTDEQSYIQNNKVRTKRQINQTKKGNTFTDYYQTNRQRF